MDFPLEMSFFFKNYVRPPTAAFVQQKLKEAG